MNTPGTITNNPVNSTVCQGSNASFTVSAAGSSPLYQWQVSTDGGMNYTNLAGATAATLNLPAVTNNMSLNRYRTIVTIPSCGSVTSGSAILKVNPLPEVTLSSAPLTQIRPGLNTTLFATSNPTAVSYSWTLGGSVIPGATGSTLVVTNINGLGKYKATVTDINGCSNTTDELTLTALQSDLLFIYPSPTSDGIFHVRLFTRFVANPRKITIYNSQGALVAERDYYANQSYQDVTFDFSKMAAGIYTVEVKDRLDLRKAVGKVIIR
jgi:hypothetical protein